MTGFSIRARLFWALVAAIAVLSAAASAAIYFRAKSDINDLFDYEMQQMAFMLGMHMSAHAGLDEPLLRMPHDFVTQVWRGDTLIVSSTPGAGPDRALPAGFGVVGGDRSGWRTFTAKTPDHTLQVAQRIADRRQFAAAIAVNAVIPAAAMLPLGGLIIWFGIGYGLRPLRAIGREISARNPDSLSQLNVANPPAEIAPLVTELNALLARVEQGLQKERQFIADASHELRTPVTAVGLQIDLLESAQTAEERDEALHDVKLGVARLRHLIEQILTLARLDPDAAERDEAVSLSEFLEEVYGEFEPIAAAKNVSLSLSVAAPVVVTANTSALRALVRNFVDNGVRHTPAGGSVRIALAQANEEPTITITDSGAGIPEHLRQKVFGRFIRGDNTEAHGTGLGLSIAARAADKLKARITLSDTSAGTGLHVAITFQPVRDLVQ